MMKISPYLSFDGTCEEAFRLRYGIPWMVNCD
jgi:hypothetical protein